MMMMIMITMIMIIVMMSVSSPFRTSTLFFTSRKSFPQRRRDYYARPPSLLLLFLLPRFRLGSDVLLMLLPAFLGLAGHHGDIGQITRITTGLGITRQGRFLGRHHNRRRHWTAARAWKFPEHPQERTASAVGTYPLRYKLMQRRLAPIRWWTLAVEYRAIWRRPDALLVNLALLKTGYLVRAFISWNRKCKLAIEIIIIRTCCILSKLRWMFLKSNLLEKKERKALFYLPSFLLLFRQTNLTNHKWDVCP